MTTVHKKAVSGRRAKRLAFAFAELIPANKRVLDVGCGNGKLAKLVLELRPDLEICGIDVKCSEDAEIAIMEYDGCTIPFASESWDVCIASDVLHHCDDPIKILSEMTRVAKDSIVLKDHISSGRFSRALLCAMDWIGNYGYGTDVPFNFLSAVQWEKAYAQLGLTPTSTKVKLGLYPAPLTWLCDRDLHFVALLSLNK